MMRRELLLLLGLMVIVGGCGAQDLVGGKSNYLFTVTDTLALPNRETQLQARLQGGDFLKPQVGHVVRFYRDGQLYKAAETNQDGIAAIAFTPDRTGDFLFRAEAASAGFETDPPDPQELRVVCRAADTPMMVVDLDKTVVGSGFHVVLMGNPEPMAGSLEVLKRLAETYTIVYLTHRPVFFSITSKQWLLEQGYPPGAVMLSSVEGFIKGNEEFKSEVIAELRRTFTGMDLGIGDKVSDAAAYHANGLKAYLLIQEPTGDNPVPYETMAEELKGLDGAVQVVTSWEQIAKGLFGGASFPRERMQASLLDRARALRMAQDVEPETTPDRSAP